MHAVSHAADKHGMASYYLMMALFYNDVHPTHLVFTIPFGTLFCANWNNLENLALSKG